MQSTGNSDREQIERGTYGSVTQKMRTATLLRALFTTLALSPSLSLSLSSPLARFAYSTPFWPSGEISTGETRVTNRNEKRKSLWCGGAVTYWLHCVV